MKKLLTLFLSTLMVFATFGNAVFADENPDLQDTNLTYEVTEGYEWSVPTKLNFTAENFADVVATDGSGNASKIAISKCTLTADKTLLIEVDADQVFKIAESNGHTLDYSIKANDVSVGAGDVVLSLDSGEECEGVDSEIKGTLTKDVNEIAGDYSGTLTFLAEIVRGGKAIKVVADGTTATNVRFTAMPTNKQDALKADLKLAGTSSLSDAELAAALVIDIDADTAGDVKMDISRLANEGDKVLVYHKSSTNGWELLGEVEVGADGTVTCSFTDYSPILVSKKGGSSQEQELLSLGGKVFLDNGDNGATYKFYDASKNEITYADLSSLDNAVYYEVEGTPTKDRFYVVASDSNQTDYNSDYGVNLGTEKYWGYYSITTEATTNTIGSGKTNTAQILAITDTSGFNLADGGVCQSIWEWLGDVNSNEYGGHSDWFIGSEAEYDALRTSGKAGSLFDSMLVWTSVEDTSNNAYFWRYYDSFWFYDFKANNFANVVAFRAF